MKEMYCEKTNDKRAYGVTPATRRLLPINVCGNGYALRAG